MKPLLLAASLFAGGFLPQAQVPADGNKPVDGVPVIARIEVDANAPLPYVGLSFLGSSSPIFSNNISVPDGTLKTNLIPGLYRISVIFLSDDYSLVAMTSGDTDLLNVPLTVLSGVPADLKLKFHFPLAGVRVRGRVTGIPPSVSLPLNISLSAPIALTVPDPRVTPARFGRRSVSSIIKTDGTFEFASVIPGPYVMDFGSLLLHHAIPVTIGNSDVSGLEIAVPRQVDMTAQIVVEGGGPLPRPNPVMKIITDPPAQFSHGISGALVQADGIFRMKIPEGDYQLSFDRLPPSYYVKAMTLGTKDILDQPWTLSPGASNVQITLAVKTPTPWKKVSGRVINAPSAGSTSSDSITLHDPALNLRFETTIAPDGSFEFSKVIPGTYDIGFVSAEGSGSPRLIVRGGNSPPGTAKITVTDSDIGGATVVLGTSAPAFSSVTGRVEVEGGGPMPRFGVIVNGGGGSVDISAEGVFHVTLPLTPARIQLKEYPEQYVLKSFTFGTTDLLKEPAIAVSGDSRELHAAFAPVGVNPWKQIRGRISELSNLGQGPFELFLSSLHQNIRTPVAADGTFVVTRAVPGEYILSLRPPGDPLHSPVELVPRVVVADADSQGVVLTVPRTIPLRVVTEDGKALHLLVQRMEQSGRVLGMYFVQSPRREFFGDGEKVSLARIPFGYKLKSMTYGGIDLTKEAIRFSEPATEIVISLEVVPADPSTPEFRILGRVRSVSGRDATNKVTATYMDYFGVREIYTVMEVPVQTDGSFEFDRLPSGAYEIRVIDQPGVARVIVSDADSNGVLLSIP